MRPEWFCCERCLFFKGSDCFHDVQKTTDANPCEYCSQWTCANCWQEWDDYFFANGDPQIYTDHTKCKSVVFGEKP